MDETLVEQGQEIAEIAIERVLEQTAAEEVGLEIIDEVQEDLAKNVAKEAVR